MAFAFTYEALPMRVVFGPGSRANLPEEMADLGLCRALVLCSPEQEKTGQMIAQTLDDQAAGIFAEARMHVPADLVNRAGDLAQALGVDGCVAVGGGSAVGLGKAIALEHHLPVIAVPTTYAGSEMTPIWGITAGGEKRTGRDARVLPRSVIYDPELTLTLPATLSATSGLNAIAHATEGLYAPDATPIVSLMAQEGVRALVHALPQIVTNGEDLEARAQAQYGAWLCGAVLAATTMSLHHKICHVLGGMLDLPHAQTHAVVLPHALGYNQAAAPQAMRALSHALGGVADPARALWEVASRLGCPCSLRELDVAEDDLPSVAEAVLEQPYANPRRVTFEDLLGLLKAAWLGDPPELSDSSWTPTR